MGFGAEQTEQHEQVAFYNEPPAYTQEQTTAYSQNATSQDYSRRDSIKSTNLEFDSKLAEETQKAQTALMDEINQYNQATEHAEHLKKQQDDEEDNQFTVRDPQMENGAIRYLVTGTDSDGNFSIKRRYKEFFTMRRVLAERWPGCYVPCIPEKVEVKIDVKTMKVDVKANKEKEFVEERRILLERFLRELSKFSFLIESNEFRIFARQQGEVDKTLDALPR